MLGHTCPLGGDQYNFGLGMRRAEAVAGWLMAHGVDPMRITTTSAGERQLVNSDVSGYTQNRRAELHFRARGDEPPDLVWAQQALDERIGPPPYRAVEQYVPREAINRNDPQEDWHWGSLTSSMTGEVDHWIAHYVGDAKAGLLTDPHLDDRTIPVPDLDPAVPPVTIRSVVLHPRPAVQAILDEIIADPTGVVGTMVGEPAANRSTTPQPPGGPCLRTP